GVLKVRRGGGGSRNEEPASAGTGLPNDVKPGRRKFWALDNHVLQKVAQVRFDGQFVASVDFQIVGNRPLLVDLSVGLRENGAWRIAKASPCRLQFLERRQASLEAR